MAATNRSKPRLAVSQGTTPPEDRLHKLNRQLGQIRYIAFAAEEAQLAEEDLNSIVGAISDIADDMAVDLRAVMGALARGTEAAP